MKKIKEHIEEIRELLEIAMSCKDSKAASEAYCKTYELEKMLDKKIKPFIKKDSNHKADSTRLPLATF